MPKAALGERRDLASAYRLVETTMIIALCGDFADEYVMAASLGIDATEAHALFGKFNPTAVLLYLPTRTSRFVIAG